MQVLKDLRREWQVAELKATHAEQIIDQARQAQREGRGTGPTAQQLATAKRLRALADDLQTQLKGRADTLRRGEQQARH